MLFYFVAVEIAFCCVTSAVSRCAVPFSPGKRETYWLCRTRTAFQRYAFFENTRRGVRFFCVEMTIALCFAKYRWRSGVIFVQIVLPVALPVLHVPRFSMPPPPMSVPALVGWETALSRFLAKTGNPFSEHGQFSRFHRGFSRAYVRALCRFSFFAFTVCVLSVDI